MRLSYLVALLVSGVFGTALSQECSPTPERNAVRILGTGMDGGLTDQAFPYIAGDRNFYQTLDNGWIFALVKAENGWSLRLYEGEPVGDAVDLTSMTPPLRGAPNPRDIFGWHFRNADNTGPNEGDVNAPQHMRAFVISPSLAGTGGFRPPEGAQSEPSPDDGIGWLKVLDFGLAGLEPGQRARMNYLKFDACLSWPRSQGEQDRLTDLASPAYTEVDYETFGSCGLDLQAIDLDTVYLPRLLGGDLDGDGALDEAAQIRRKADGKRGIALCRAGTWLHTLGLDDRTVGDLTPGYIDQVEAWQWVTQDGDVPRHLQGFDLPDADGDILVLERIEKQAMLVFWEDGALKAELAYGYVEP